MTRISLEDLTPDLENANKGTERGHRVLNKSIGRFGAGRSMVVDRDGRIVAGNKTHEMLTESGMVDAVVVETDGRTAVVVKRTDFDLSDKGGAARQYAYFDNRAGELSLLWDSEQIAHDLEEGVDLGGLFSDKELDKLMEIAAEDEQIGPDDVCSKCGQSILPV